MTNTDSKININKPRYIIENGPPGLLGMAGAVLFIHSHQIKPQKQINDACEINNNLMFAQ